MFCSKEAVLNDLKNLQFLKPSVSSVPDLVKKSPEALAQINLDNEGTGQDAEEKSASVALSDSPVEPMKKIGGVRRKAKEAAKKTQAKK